MSVYEENEQLIKDMFKKDFREDYLKHMQDDYEAGKISSVAELLYMAYATGFVARQNGTEI